MKHYFLIFLFFFPVYCFASSDNTHNHQIDTLISLSDDYHYRDPLKSFMYAKRACILADQTGTSRQKADAYFYMAKSLIFFGRYNESYTFIKKGKNEKAVKNDPFLMANFIELAGIYYSRLYMLPQEMKENKAALKLVNIHKNADSKLFVSRIYMWMADYYTEKRVYDSAHLYIDKSIQLAEEIPENEYLSMRRVFRRKAYGYYYKAQIYIQQHEKQLALPFIEKAYKQTLSEQNTYIYPILEAYGDYYFLSKEYETAIDYYLKAIENKKKYLFACADINLKISQCYMAMGDVANEKKFLRISSQQRRYDEKISRKNISEIAENMFSEEIEKNKSKRNENIFFISLIIFIFLLSLGVLFYKLKHIQKRNHKIIAKKNNLLQKKAHDLVIKEKKITVLQEKMDDSIAEIIQMAKHNSPEFWSRFQTIYPDFTGKMLKIHPTFKTSELTLSAYLYLGFTTKEISQYTFKSVKTIENNRHNFRKKINIASEEDLSVWIKEYIKNTELK